MTTPHASIPPTGHSVPATTVDVPGLPFYEKSRLHLRDLLRKQQTLQRNLANLEDTIYRKETEYLEDTPSGNIILGFDGFVKGAVLGGGGGRRGGVEGDRSRAGDGRARGIDGVRLFSRSSVSFRPVVEGVVSNLLLSTLRFRYTASELTNSTCVVSGFTARYWGLYAR